MTDMSRDGQVFDAVIIGGGPAGAVAARLLATWGRSALLLTRAPARNALAESLPPSCRKLLDRVGIADVVDSAGFMRATGNTVRWGEAAAAARAFASGERGWQVSRDRLDRVLLDSARQAGAQVLVGASVRTVTEATARTPVGAAPHAGGGRDTGRRVVHDGPDGPVEVIARWVIDASGRSGVAVPREWRRPAPAGRTLALVGMWRHPRGWDLDDETHTLVESWDEGWAWSVPVAPGERTFALMVDPSAAAGATRDSLAGIYHREMQRTQWFRALVATGALTAQPWACDASAYGAACVGEDGLILAGDAATFVDPLSSYGVKKALASAWLAAIVVNTCLDEPGLAPHALGLHAARERAMYESLSRQSAALARDAQSAHANAFWEDRAGAPGAEAQAGSDVAALRADPDVVAAFQSLRERAAIRVRRGDGAQQRDQPIVRDNRIVLAAHLVSPAFREGIRYIRDIDLVTLAAMAPDFDQVPDLFDAYNRSAPPVALPDFLGALSVLLGKGLLQHS